MSVTFIPTIGRRENDAVAAQLVRTLRSGEVYAEADRIVLYAGWPQVKDYDGRTHSSDLTVVSDSYGIKLVKISLSAEKADVRRDAISVLQTAATTESLMGKSLQLKKRRKLIFDVVPIIYAPNLDPDKFDNDEVEMSEDTLSAEDPEVSRCLERDADAFAAGAVLFRQIAIAGQQRTLGPEDILSNFRFPFCATYILLALMERPLHNGGMSKATHPPSLVRMMSLLPTCHAFLQSWRTGIEFDEMTEPVSLCTRAVELTLLSIGGGCLTNEEVDAGACP